MNTFNENDLKYLAKKVRENIITLSTNGGSFAGAALSAVDVITYIYSDFMNISKEILDSDERDYFILSKGHAVPVLYGLFVELGWLERDRLENHLKTNDNIYWHPNTKIPGIDFHSGSLGHGLPISIGVAKDIKMKRKSNKILVMVGDGELNEGSNWEAIMAASAFKLDNLILIIDRNKFQANMQTEELIPMDSYLKKFEAFSWNCFTIDGHDFNDLNNTFNKIDLNSGKPNVIIAETIRGKGISSIEARADKWFVNFSESEAISAMKELT